MNIYDIAVDGSPVFTGDMNSLPAVKQKSSRSAATKPTVMAPNLLVDLPGGKNPVSLLYELYSQTLTLDDDLTSEIPGVFVARVRIEDRNFQVCQHMFTVMCTLYFRCILFLSLCVF